MSLKRRRKSVGDCTLLTLLLGGFEGRQAKANVCNVRRQKFNFFCAVGCFIFSWVGLCVAKLVYGLCLDTAKLSAAIRSFRKSGQDVKGRWFNCLVDGCWVVF